MLWDPQYALRQLLAAMPGPPRWTHRKDRTSPGSQNLSCGRCPTCHEFVQIRIAERDGQVPCPNCSSPIRMLEPLVSEGKTDVSGELYMI
jgi:hypothetical protein